MLDKALSMMDDTFSDYIKGKMSDESFEAKLGKVMSALPLKNHKNFEVAIVNNNKKEPFFGLRIFPVIAEMDMIAEEIINKRISFNKLIEKWRSIENWYLEIDAQVFLRYEINFTPKELTAMVIHEIGHTLYSEKLISIMYNAFKESQMRMKLADKASLKVLYSLYMIPLSIGCMQKNFIDSKNQISVEYYADSILKEYGYLEHLASALDKIIKAYGSQNESDNYKKKNITQSIVWCNMNVADLARRKEKLKDEIFYQSIKTESNYFKAVCVKVLNEIGVKMRERYSGAVVECTIDMLQSDYTYGDEMLPLFEAFVPFIDVKIGSQLDRRWHTVKESFNEEAAVEGLIFNRKYKKVQLPTQQEIDEIMIEIDKIQNNRDRIYVLELIYNLSERIDVYEQYHRKKEVARDKAKIDVLRREIENLRTAVLNKKPLSKEYKFFVRYPEGYEG